MFKLRKFSVDLVKMVVVMFNEVVMMMDGIVFGIMCLNMMWKNLLFDDLEYKMNLCFFNVNVFV